MRSSALAPALGLLMTLACSTGTVTKAAPSAQAASSASPAAAAVAPAPTAPRAFPAITDAPKGVEASAPDTWPVSEGVTNLAVVRMDLVRGLDAVDMQPRTLQGALEVSPPPGLDVSGLPPGTWLHGAVPVTKTESIPFAVSSDRQALVLDRDRDGRLSADERAPAAGAWGGLAWFQGEVPVRQRHGDRVLQVMTPVKVGVMLAGPRAVSRLDARREGHAEIDGRSVRLAIVDQTFRGWFGHPRLDALVVDVDGDGALDPSPDSFERYRLGDPFPAGDLDVVVTAVGPLGSTLTLARSPRPAARRASLRPGSAAPAFSATTVDGKPLSLASLRGKWVLLDFWATWCGPCRAELPHLKALRKQHADVVVVGISGDQAVEAVTRFVAAEGLDWPQIHADARKIMAPYRVTSFPTSFLLAPDGTIAARDLRGPGLVARVGQLKAERARKPS